MNNLEVILYHDAHNLRFLELKPSNDSKFSDEVYISLFSKNTDRYLVGKDHWHGEEFFFGPCPNTSPEVVYFGAKGILDSLVENSFIRIKAGGLVWEGIFPQSILWNAARPDSKFWVEKLPDISNPVIPTPPPEPDTEPNLQLDINAEPDPEPEPEIKSESVESSDKNLLKAILFIILLTGCLAYFVWHFDLLKYFSNPELDSVTQCPANEVDSKTIVLVDGTDEIPILFKRKMENMCLGRFIDSVPNYGLLELRLMLEREKGGKVHFSRCRTEDSNWRSSFSESLKRVLDSIKKPTEPHKTPLLETIQLIALEHFEKSDTPQNNRLIVISDMIENTDDFSHFEGYPFYEIFVENGAEKKFRTELNDAEVEICLIGREGSYFDALELVDFWDLWIEESGGKLNRQGAK